MASPLPNRNGREERGTARTVALAMLGGFAVWLTVVGTYQVLKQSFWPELRTTHFDCRDGAHSLLQALESARNRASEQTLNEREALSTFRADLEPVWQQAAAIRYTCEMKRDQVALRALRSLELLRYAEERSIRLSAVDLTQLRRSTPRLVSVLSSKQP